MSSAIRKLERSAVRTNLQKSKENVKKGFESGWQSFRERKYIVKDDDGNVIKDNTPSNTMPKKKRYFDNVEQYTRMFAFYDSLRAKSKEATLADK